MSIFLLFIFGLFAWLITLFFRQDAPIEKQNQADAYQLLDTWEDPFWTRFSEKTKGKRKNDEPAVHIKRHLKRSLKERQAERDYYKLRSQLRDNLQDGEIIYRKFDDK